MPDGYYPLSHPFQLLSHLPQQVSSNFSSSESVIPFWKMIILNVSSLPRILFYSTLCYCYLYSYPIFPDSWTSSKKILFPILLFTLAKYCVLYNKRHWIKMWYVNGKEEWMRKVFKIKSEFSQELGNKYFTFFYWDKIKNIVQILIVTCATI